MSVYIFVLLTVVYCSGHYHNIKKSYIFIANITQLHVHSIFFIGSYRRLAYILNILRSLKLIVDMQFFYLSLLVLIIKNTGFRITFPNV